MKTKIAATPKTAKVSKARLAKQAQIAKVQATVKALPERKKNDVKDIKTHFQQLQQAGVKAMLIPKKAPEPKVRPIEPKQPPKVHAELLRPPTSIPFVKRH